MIYLPKNVRERMMVSEYLSGFNMEEVKDNPVCPRCERVAMRDKGWMQDKVGQCSECGYRGRMAVTVGEYARQKLYR